MNLKNIDSGCFKLTAQQAKALVVGNALPVHGHERRADLELVNTLCVFSFRSTCTKDGWKQGEVGSKAVDAWISRTPLSWFDGQPVRNGWTWMIRVRFN